MVITAVGSNPALDSLVPVRNSSPGRLGPCEGTLVAAAGSCGGLMVKHPWPLLEISLSDFRRPATLNINTYLPTWRRGSAMFGGRDESQNLPTRRHFSEKIKQEHNVQNWQNFTKLSS